VRPHATAQTFADQQAGTYRLVAAPGLGYQYRWIEGTDEASQGDDDGEHFDGKREFEFKLAPQGTKQVSLKVKNAFGFTATRRFEFERPPPDPATGGGQGVIIEMEDGKPSHVVLPDGTKRRVNPRPVQAPRQGGAQ